MGGRTQLVVSGTSLADGSGLYKKAGSIGHEEQSRKQCSFMASASATASRLLLGVLAPTSLGYELWYRTVSRRKHFPL